MRISPRIAAGLAAIALAAPGCTGLTMGLNAPGADTYLGLGSLAVDHRTDKTFVLSSHYITNTREQRLYAIDADSGEAQLLDQSRHWHDPRLLFPYNGVLLMAEVPAGEQLTIFDTKTHARKRRTSLNARYHGTRMSQSRRWIALADNDADATPIHILDPSTLTARVIPHSGDWLEATWLNKTDSLIAAIFHHQQGPQPPSVRIASWSLDKVRAAGFSTDTTGAWSDADWDITIPGKIDDLCLSFTWISVSPNDRWVVVPLRDATTKAYELVVVDTADKSYRVVAGAKGPVGFTADSQTIVSYTWRDGEQLDPKLCGVLPFSPKPATKSVPTPNAGPSPNGGPKPGAEPRPNTKPEPRDNLLLIETASLKTQTIKIPRTPVFNFLVSGSLVTVAPAFDSRSRPHPPLFLFDTSAPDSGTVIEPAEIHLREVIERPAAQELWLISHDRLQRLDLRARALEPIALSFTPKHLNYLPNHDWLVLDQPALRRSVIPDELVFFDPQARTIRRRISLPDG